MPRYFLTEAGIEPIQTLMANQITQVPMIQLIN